jgi:guanine deaminase
MNPVSHQSVEVYQPGYLVVSYGKIEGLSNSDPRPDLSGPAEITDHGGKRILPGLIDAHVHLPQFAIMGVGTGELLTWLKEYAYPEEARFADPEYAEKITRQFFNALVANGTTTASIYCSVHEHAADIAFSVAEEKGIRAFIGKTMMDRNAPEDLQEDTEESFHSSMRLLEKWDGRQHGRLRYSFTPRFAGCCSMQLMKRVGQAVQELKANVQTHLNENPDEVAWVRSLFPEHKSYTDIYAAAGLLGSRSLMAHCIHLSQHEIHMLASTRTNVAFCPYSNRMLRSGTMPYAALRRAGLRIGLGSDVAGGPTLSMLKQMEIAQEEVGIALSEALYLATLGAAEALGVDDRVGNFAEGKDADFIVLDDDGIVEQVWIQGARRQLLR